MAWSNFWGIKWSPKDFYGVCGKRESSLIHIEAVIISECHRTTIYL